MLSTAVVDLSRLQFAATALYHFLFVPLTIGLVLILAIMETIYVLSGKEIWRRMVQFWGLLFGINFAMGVATGITMEFQFGTNWAKYSQFVGDIFGSPLAIEGLMAFFLEATFVGLFFFGWKVLSKRQHLLVTWLVFLGSNFSALWILIANGWMQHPVGARFNPFTLRMELSSFKEVLFNDMAQASFMHAVSASYTYGALFVLGGASIFLLKRKFRAFATRSALVGSVVGLAGIAMTIYSGDENGYLIAKHQPPKMAAIEGIWRTEPAPASFNVFAIPSDREHKNFLAVRIPWVLGIIGTRSLHQTIPGLDQIQRRGQDALMRSVPVYGMLQALHTPGNPHATLYGNYINHHLEYLGYSALLSRYAKDMRHLTSDDLMRASEHLYPKVWPLFYTFRLMVLLGFYFLALFIIWFALALRDRVRNIGKIFLWVTIVSIPLPLIAAELGWFVQEFGRQPWAVFELLPTATGVSQLSLTQVVVSLGGFVLLYSVLFVVDVVLLLRYLIKGPGAYLQDLPKKYVD